VARVVVSSRLSVDVRPWLGDDVEIVGPVGRAQAMSREELIGAVGGADALICLLTDRVDEALLAAAPKLRVVANHAVGVDNVDLAAATRRKVVVTNTPDVLTEATADLTMALVLAAARRIGEGERLVRAGGWRGWEPAQLLGADLAGKTIGLVGFGRIGRAVARRARGFGLRVIYASPRKIANEDATHVPLDRLLAESDVISLHCPLTPETRGLIGREQLARMKPGAIFINTARGACVDEPALGEALAAGTIAGAGIDVYEREPNVHPALLAQERAVLLPHIGSATVGTRAKMAELCARAVRAVLSGERPSHVVNTEVIA
jgi:glyoxylate reductase